MSEIRIGDYAVTPAAGLPGSFRVWAVKGPVRIGLSTFEDEAVALRHAINMHERRGPAAALDLMVELETLICASAPHHVLLSLCGAALRALRDAGAAHA